MIGTRANIGNSFRNPGSKPLALSSFLCNRKQHSIIIHKMMKKNIVGLMAMTFTVSTTIQAQDFLATHDRVDSNRIGIIGICGFGGFAVNAAAQDTRIKATLAITTISERLGFEYPQHFVRFFKAHTGKTPSAYRKAS